MMTNESIFITKNPIPFLEAQLTIHNPELQEIFMIGEDLFHRSCQFLNFSKDQLNVKDNLVIDDKSDFDIFMSIICDKEGRVYKRQILLLLTILFPEYNVKFYPDKIEFKKGDFITFINNDNFDSFKEIVNAMFGLHASEGSTAKYNPADAAARRIAEKLKKRKKNDSEDTERKQIRVFERMISVLSVGESKDINELLGYTVYQLKIEFKRFQLKQNFDIFIQAKMAGAQDLDDVDNWMDDIHP